MDKVFEMESLDAFQSVANNVLNHLFYSGPLTTPLHLDNDSIEKAKMELISIFNDCNFDMQEVTETMNKRWAQDKVKIFVNLIDQNKSKILYAALNHYNSSYGDTLVNFDWVIKYVLGTSELKNLKYPLLQLVVSTLNKNGKQDKIIFEAKKDMLLKMINVLEDIK